MYFRRDNAALLQGCCSTTRTIGNTLRNKVHDFPEARSYRTWLPGWFDLSDCGKRSRDGRITS
jgi:hypothetical protein